MNQRGNVLFLILIAVALFAALSYAVMSSSRGSGSGTEAEQAELDISVLLNQLSSLKTELLRVQFDGDVVLFNTATGDFYDPAWNPTIIQPPLDLKDSDSGVADDDFTWRLYTLRTRLAGLEQGTTAEDQYISLPGVRQSFCEAFNLEFYGVSTPGVVTSTFTPGRNYTMSYVNRSMMPLTTQTVGAGFMYDFSIQEGCFVSAGVYSLYFLVNIK